MRELVEKFQASNVQAFFMVCQVRGVLLLFIRMYTVNLFWGGLTNLRDILRQLSTGNSRGLPLSMKKVLKKFVPQTITYLVKVESPLKAQ